MDDRTRLGRELLAKVRANHALLESCKKHDFQPEETPVRLGTRYRCTACGGSVDATAKHWYDKGTEHAAS